MLPRAACYPETINQYGSLVTGFPMRHIFFMALVAAACSPDPGASPADTDLRVDASATDTASDDGDAASNDSDLLQPDAAAPDMLAPDLVQAAVGWSDRAAIALGPRQESAVVAMDGLVWVLGGFNAAAQVVALVEAYDPATDSWTRRADFPVRAHHINATVADGQIWVTGFLTGGFVADGRSFVYDPVEDSWSPGADMPAGRARGASATGAIDGTIYVAGGLAGSAVSLFDSFDPASGTWTPLPDVPRDVDHAAFGVFGNVFVIASGRSGGISSVSGQVDRFVPADGVWTTGAPIPTARGGVASAMLEGELFVFGGEGNSVDPSGVFADVEAYDVAADNWRTLDPMPIPRHGLGAASVGGVIYLPGGAKVQALGAVDDHQAFRPR